MSKGLGDMVGLLGFERDEYERSGGSFDKRTNSRLPAFANNEIAFPMARDNTIFDCFGSFFDADEIRYGAVPGSTILASGPFPTGTLLFQGSNEFFL
jgi:hypothetical protein